MSSRRRDVHAHFRRYRHRCREMLRLRHVRHVLPHRRPAQGGRSPSGRGQGVPGVPGLRLRSVQPVRRCLLERSASRSCPSSPWKSCSISSRASWRSPPLRRATSSSIGTSSKDFLVSGHKIEFWGFVERIFPSTLMKGVHTTINYIYFSRAYTGT